MDSSFRPLYDPFDSMLPSFRRNDEEEGFLPEPNALPGPSYWLDPTPPLPSALPLNWRLDRRLRPPGFALAPPDGWTSRHTLTGASTHPAANHWTRRAVFIHPGKDVAYAAWLVLHRQGAQVDPNFFWRLGNPPLCSKAASQRLVKLLREQGYLDPDNICHKLVPAQALEKLLDQAWKKKSFGHKSPVGADFARWAHLALGMAYDCVHYAAKDLVRVLYAFDVPNVVCEFTVAPPPRAPIQPTRAPPLRERELQLAEQMEAAFRHYQDDLMTQAIQEAVADAPPGP